MSSESDTASPAELAEYVEDYLPEDDAVTAARTRATELGCRTIGGAAGATLRLLAATVQARAVVEVGTGAGVSGLHLLRGMTEDGVLTSIDIEPEHHRAARATFSGAGYPAGRSRLIMGRALDVLPRLTTGGYDLVFVDAARIEYPTCCEQGVQLLRTGGLIVFHGVLAGGRINEPTLRDPETLALREVSRMLRDDERLVPAMLPVRGGLLAAALAG